MVDPHIFAIVGIAIILDIVTGITQACYNRTIDSSKMRSGVYHKLSFIFAVSVAAFIEYAMNYIDLGYTLPLIVPTCGYIVLTELVSIVENISKMNPELKGSGIFNFLGESKNRRENDDRED